MKQSNTRYASTLISLAALAALMFVVAGVALGAFFFPNVTPASLHTARSVTSIPITEREVDDRATVDVSLSIGSDAKLSSPATGLVTRFSCNPGEKFYSGESNLSLDGEPLLNLATAAPLWRDLEWGSSGADVDALHEELTRLGADITADGTRVSRQTFAAVSQLLEKNGGSADLYGEIRAAQFLWLPASETTIKSCAAATGAPIGAGEEVATLPGRLTGTQIKQLPERAVAGERTLTIDDVDIAVNEDGSITEPQALAQLSASAAFEQAIRDQSNSLSAVWKLTSPLSVFVVPPGSLYQVEGSSACVTDKTRTYQVTIVGSELGQSFVTFDNGRVPKNITLSPESPSTCT